MSLISEYKKTLQEYGIKVTTPRLHIFAFLFKTRKPKTAQDIHEAFKGKGMDIVTIYRTLASFEKAGLVRRVDLRKDTVFYELAGEHHHHIVCTNCGDVEDFELCNIESLTKKITGKAKKFKTINQHSFELFGVCTACAC